MYIHIIANLQQAILGDRYKQNIMLTVLHINITGSLKAAYIPTTRGKYNLVLDGFSFCESPPTYWVCSRRKNIGCRAAARTNKSGEVIAYNNNHNHEKPEFFQMTSNKKIKL